MDRYARWNALLELLTETGRISVEEAADRLVVSQATIRRDFDQLAQQQMITRTRGGAVVNGVSYDLPLRYKSAKHASEKQRIGAAAAALVAPAMVVGLTGGTTTTEVARALASRPDLAGTGPDGPQLTVVTNALNIANELIVRSRMKIVVTGGVIRPQSYELVGPLATGILRELTLDLAFLGRGRVRRGSRRGVPSRGGGGDEQPAGLARPACRGDRRLVQTGQARLRPGMPGREGSHPGDRRRGDRGRAGAVPYRRGGGPRQVL